MSNSSFTVKVEGADKLINALSAYPKILRKYTHRLTTDEAVEYKRLGAGVIGEKETIRNPAYVNSAFVFNRSQGTSIDNIFASAGTTAPESSGRFGGGYSGWVELIDPSIAPRRERVIGPASRGGSMAGKVKKNMRLDLSKQIPNSKNFSGPQVRPGKRNVQFMTSLAKKKHKGVFILEAENGKHGGLYIFSNDWGSGEKKYIFPKPIRLQDFDAKMKSPHFDFNEAIVKKVQAKFTESYIIKNYLEPALEEAMKQKK
ncbi:hypothetical protein AGMMS50268_01950 [Spirochaetia bacterium]|nr:hypothetical protein AGMMS50268_01950 [Spirochaetia bacterium]